MRNQRLQIDQTLRNQHDGFRIRFTVAKLETNVDLPEACCNERDRLEIFPYANDED